MYECIPKEVVVMKRKSFVFDESASKDLIRLTKVCRLDSQSNTVRLALTVLGELVTQIQAGNTIVVRDGRGNEELYHPLLEKAGA